MARIFFQNAKIFLESVAITADKILLEYLVNACSEIVTLDHFGKEAGKIPLPKYSSLAGISTRRTEKEFFLRIRIFHLSENCLQI